MRRVYISLGYFCLMVLECPWKKVRQLAEGNIIDSIRLCVYKYVLSRTKSGRTWTFMFGQRLETSMEGEMVIVAVNPGGLQG